MFQNLQIQMEEREIEQERKTQELALDKRNLENQIKRLQNQINQATSIEDLNFKLKEKEDEVESLRGKMCT